VRRWVYSNGKAGRPEADPDVLHKRVQHRTPSFDQFFYRAVKDHLLADGRIEAEEAGGCGRWSCRRHNRRRGAASSCTNSGARPGKEP
jgi:hypothetical protein